MEELKLVLVSIGYALILTLALHAAARIMTTAYFKSKREHIRRMNNG